MITIITMNIVSIMQITAFPWNDDFPPESVSYLSSDPIRGNTPLVLIKKLHDDPK